MIRLKNPKERNKLTFEDNIDKVYDSVLIMNEIANRSHYNYFAFGVTDSNKLFFINYQLQKRGYKVGVISDSLLYLNNSLYFLDEKDKKRFLILCDFLNKNYLSRCDVRNRQIEYAYRIHIYMADSQTDLMRFIVIADSINEIDYTKYKILDKYKDMFLLAYKEAKIY
jgi:hypothetical protein